jgi:hypothetical protein
VRRILHFALRAEQAALIERWLFPLWTLADAYRLNCRHGTSPHGPNHPQQGPL